MARREQYRDTHCVKELVTLMPVRPSSEQSSESLSHDGETAITMGATAQPPGGGIPGGSRREVGSDDDEGGTGDDDAVVEARVARGKKSPKDPTRKEKERSTSSRTCHFAVGAKIA